MTEEASCKYNVKNFISIKDNKRYLGCLAECKIIIISSIRGNKFEKILDVANLANGFDLLDDAHHYVFLCSIHFDILYERFFY